MILTEELFNEGMSINGNWSDAQIECFGITRNNNKGWKSQIIGGDFDSEVINKFINLRNKHLASFVKKDVRNENIGQIMCVMFLYLWYGGKLRI